MRPGPPARHTRGVGTSDFVGRGADVAELEAVLERTGSGHGELVLVPGEAGVGKTRLAEEVVDRARAWGMTVAWAGCSEAEMAPAFWPWTQLLRGLLETGEDGPPAGGPLARLLPEVGGGVAKGTEVDPELARLELFDAVAAFLRRAAGKRPLLLVIDDLHWADVPSVLLLGVVAPTLRALPAVLLGTYRDVDAPPGSAVTGALPELVRHGRMLSLGGLTRADVGELVASLTGSTPPARTAATLHRHTGGNPLFVRELVRLLSASGGLEQLEDGERPAALPDGVREVLSRRLERLSEECRQLLQAGAAMGQEFGLDEVAEATKRPPGEVLEHLDEAVQARVVGAAGLGRYVFGHALVRGAVYQELGLARRVRLHQQLGEALEARVERGAEVDPAQLAWHFLIAAPGGNAAKALRYTAEAGDRAMAALAYEDAGRLYQQALSALELDRSAGDRGELLCSLGDARAAAGALPGAREAYREAALVARAAGRADLLARAGLGMGSGSGGFEVPLHDREQIELLEESLTRLDGEVSALRAVVMARLSVALSYAGAEDRRLTLSREAVSMARRADDPAALAYALAAHCDATAGPAHTEARLEEATEVIALASALGDRGLELMGRRLRLVALLELGDTRAADAEVQGFARLAEALGQPLYLWYVPLWRGLRAFQDGRLDEAERLTAEAAATGARAHSENAAMLTGVQRWFALRERGRSQEALEANRRLSGLVADLGVQTYPSLALALAEAGRRAEAGAWLDRVAGELGAASLDSEWLPMMGELVEALAAYGDHPAAELAYELLLPYRSRFVIEGIGAVSMGSAERHLGVLAGMTGRRDAAAAHFAAALAANRGGGAPLLVAHTLRDAGRFLADPEPLAEALSIYRELGLEYRASEVESLLAGPPPSKAAAAAASNVFRWEGELWTVGFARRVVHLKDAKGLRDLALLLARPGQEVHALELTGARAPMGGRRPSVSEGLHPPGHAGEVLDERAKTEYRARLRDLDDEVEDAEAAGDPERAARAKAERDFLVDQLSSALGLGGRARRTGDAAERARSAVTQRIREAIARIERAHPELGSHLRRSVRTGTFCAYDPAEPLTWEL